MTSGVVQVAGATTSSEPSPLTVPANTSSPGSRSTGYGFAGDGLLIDARPPGGDAAVDRNALAGADAHALASRDRCGGDDLGLAVGFAAVRRFGSEFQQARERRGGRGRGSGFQGFGQAEQKRRRSPLHPTARARGTQMATVISTCMSSRLRRSEASALGSNSTSPRAMAAR